jgi:hypothetical protein
LSGSSDELRRAQTPSRASGFGPEFTWQAYCRMRPVPELTSSADIKLNTRLSLRAPQTSLAWRQSRRLAAPQYGLRTVRSGVASCPRGGPALHKTALHKIVRHKIVRHKTKATRALRRMA